MSDNLRIEIIGDAEIACKYLSWAKARINRQKTGIVSEAFEDCIVHLDASGRKITFISQTASGLIFHPRTDTVTFVRVSDDLDMTPIVAGGWGYNQETKVISRLDTRCTAPLIDSDNASMMLSGEAGIAQTVTFLEQNASYGNFYTIDSDDLIYSWKGNPNRHSVVSSGSRFICTDSNNSSSGFSCNIYQGGVVVGVGPSVGGVFANILGLRIFNNIFYAVVKYNGGAGYVTSLVSTSALRLDGTGWDFIYTSYLNYKDLPWYILSESSAICSNGDTLTETLEATLYTTVATKDKGTSISFSGEVPIFHEGLDLFSMYKVSHLNTIVVDNTHNEVLGTALETRSEFLPDQVLITRNGLDFCAAAINSLGNTWTCYPCETEVTWTGPVVPIEGSQCVRLESECYPPGTHEVVIGATVKCGTISVDGSITITIIGSPGYWGDRACLLQSTTLGYVGLDGCISVVDNTNVYCEPFLSAGTIPSQSIVEIIGNKKIIYISSIYYERTGNCPCKCVTGINTAYGFSGGEVVSVGVTEGYICYKQTGDNTYYCVGVNQDSTCGDLARCTFTVTQTLKNKIPFGSYSWVCL